MTDPTDAELEDLIAANLLVVEGGQCAFESWADIRPELVKFARDVLAEWGTPAPVGVVPAARVTHREMPAGHGTEACHTFDVQWLGVDPFKWAGPLYTAPQVLAMGRVPLTEQTIDAMWRDHWDGFVSFAEAEVIVRATEEAHGIKGGQHGAD